MPVIQVGSTTTTYGPNGEVVSEVKKPSYLIKEDGSKVVLTEEEAKSFGIGNDE